jgi:tetratricopeptide (TPR) repeat protein
MKKIIFISLVVLALSVGGGMLGCQPSGHNQALTYYNKGVALSDQARYDEAIVEYGKAIGIDPSYASAYINRGYAYIETEHYDLAITDYTKAIELDPEIRNAYNGRGTAYLYTKRYNSAALDFSKAIEIDPGFTQGYTNRDTAIGSLNQALEYNSQGISLAETGKYDEAFASFAKTIKIYPYCFSAYTNIGTIFITTKQYDFAIKAFNNAIYINRDYAPAYGGRGLAYIYTERYEEAVTDLNKALEIEDPDEASEWNNKGVALEQLGELEEAADAYNKALQLEPNNDGIKSNITLNSGMIREGGKPSGITGRYLPRQRYWVGPKAEERTTEYEMIAPPDADTFLGGVGLTVPESLIGEWINDSPRYGLVVSDGGSYWNYDVVLKIVDEINHTGPMEAEKPSTFTGTMQTKLVSITGPVTSNPDMMSAWTIGQTLNQNINGKHLGTSVELVWSGITLRLDYDGHDFMGGTTNFYEVNGKLTEYKPNGGAAIAWSYSAWLKRQR